MNLQKPDIKTVLIITYYWPPSGGGGVQRWLNFSKHLPTLGWRPIVLTPSNPSVLEQDPSLLDEISPALSVVKIPILEPYAFVSGLFKTQTIPRQGIVQKGSGFKSKILTWMRGNLLIPDTRIFWRKPAFKKACQIIRNESVDLVVTTGPPHSMHLIGLDLKRKLNVKWIADFRDPWTEWDILESLKLTRWAKASHLQLEKQVFEHADGVITVSNAWAIEFSDLHNKMPEVITNGFEIERKPTDTPPHQNKFRISHFGLINQFRSAPSLWQVLGELCHEDEQFSGELEIFLAGNVDEYVLTLLRDYGLGNKIRFTPYIPYEALPEKYQETSVFLLLTNKSKNSKGHIPGKLFEYLIQGKPILALTEPDGDVADILCNTNAGFVAEPNDALKIKNILRRLYETFRKEKTIAPAKNLDQFDRKYLTEKLSGYMNQIIS